MQQTNLANDGTHAHLSNPALWKRLSGLALDEAAVSLPFSARLARENGWSRDFAERVCEEYKRFAYMAQVSPTEITPSDEVDQAWHLHLLYTRHYWGPFTEAMGAPLHHGPTKGGKAQITKYSDQYEATKALYTREFGFPPPEDIWPSLDIRMGKAPTARRVLMADHYVVKKPPRWALGGIGAGLLALIAAPTLTLAHNDFPDDVNGETIKTMINHWFTDHTVPVIVIGVAVVVILAMLGVLGGSRNAGKKKDGGSGCGTTGADGDGGNSGGSGCGSGCGGCGG